MLSKRISTLPRQISPLLALGGVGAAWIYLPDVLLTRLTNFTLLLMVPLLLAAYYWWLPKIGGILIGSAITQLPKVLSEQLGPALATAVEGLFQKVKMKGLSDLGNAAKQNKAAVLEMVGAGDPAAAAIVKGLRKEIPDIAPWVEIGLERLKRTNPGFNLSARIADYGEAQVMPRVIEWLDKTFPQIKVKDRADELKQLFKVQDLLPGGDTE